MIVINRTNKINKQRAKFESDLLKIALTCLVMYLGFILLLIK